MSEYQRRAEQHRQSMVPPTALPPNQIMRGPKKHPNSMQRILDQLNGKLNSKHYDTFWL